MAIQKVGRYEILRELGRGGQSVAYLARDPVIGRLTAIKLMQPLLGYSPAQKKEYWERFLREAQAAGRLMHGNIAVIYDVGEADGSPFIAMEYIEGETLAVLLKKQFPIHFSRVIGLIRQVLNGLQYAHENGIIHRDIKPGNIMVTRKDVVKLVDFGIAKVDSTQITSPGHVLGTPSYMSPEQITGEKVDRRTDIFSVGVVLYQCLAGRLPFTGDHATTIVYRIVHEPYATLDSKELELPPGMEEILQKALKKKKEERFSSCAEMEKSLELLLERGLLDADFSLEGCRTVSLDNISAIANKPLSPTGGSGDGTKKKSSEKAGRTEDSSGLKAVANPPAAGRSQKYWLAASGVLFTVLFLFALAYAVFYRGDSSMPSATLLPPTTLPELNTILTTSSTMVVETSLTEAITTTSLSLSGGLPAGRSSLVKARMAATTVLLPTTTELIDTSTTSSAPVVTTTIRVIDDSKADASRKESQQAWKILVTHNHRIGGCRGNLIITEESLEYYPEKGNHNLKVVVTDIERLNWRESPNKFRISLRLKTGKEANYEAEGAENKVLLKQAYDALRRSFTAISTEATP